MNQHPIEMLDPVFRWLDGVIAEHGLEIYLVMVWLSPLLIVWILSGGFWRRPMRRQYVVNAPPVIKAQATPPPLPPVIGENRERRQWSDDNTTQWFAA